jgi:hypothetical protein
VNTPDIHRALEVIFRRPVIDFQRARSPYSSSFTIEELEVTFDNSETITTIFKNLSSEAMLEGARQAKPNFLYAPEREIQTYRSLLAELNLGTAAMYGSIVEPTLQRYWLFLEKVSGEGLYEIGEFETWLKVAQWLGRFHASVDVEEAQQALPLLLRYDASFYWDWLHRARELAGAALDQITERYDRVIEVLLALPRSVLHGEFYPSNILIQRQAVIRVCPVDWEMAAIGPALSDVAALASGKWGRDERLRILKAYCAALPKRLQPGDLITAFDCCQLQLAVHWIGWSRNWSPPQEHAHDWLAEAIGVSRRESMAPIFG